MKLYLGCALGHSPEDFRSSIEDLRKRLNKKYEVLEFIGLVKGTPQDVYNWDINNCVAKCDFFVAVCDHASLGLGYELASAIEKFKKPVLAVAQNDSKVSRLVLGIESPLYTFKRYDKLQDVIKLIDDKVAELGLN